MALALGVPVTHAAKPIVVEAEGPHFPEGWRVVDANYLAGTPCSENGMLHCGPGEAIGNIAVTDPGEYHVWLRSHGEPRRGVRVRVAGQVLAGIGGTRNAGWLKVGAVTLSGGKTEIALVEAKNGPYADVVLLTRDPEFSPKTDFKSFIPAYLLPQSSPAVQTEASCTTEDKVKLLHKIDVSGFGVWCGLRLGNLNGDDRLDIVLAQNQGQSISCLIAIDIDGGKLWQVGRPDPGNYNLDNGMRLAYRDVPDRDRRTPDADPAEPGSPITRGGPIPAQLVSSGRVLHGQR